MIRSDFAVFILTHGRANNVLSYYALKNAGYTGPIYLMVDDEDKQLDEYKRIFGDQVVVFSKQAAVDITDACDNYNRRNSVVFARNWNFVVAKQMGIKYFWQLDDDYAGFGWSIDNDGEYITADCKTLKLDDILNAMTQFLIDTKAKSVAIAQGGDFFGGSDGSFVKKFNTGKLSRKVMNSFVFDTDNPCEFRGRVNDDVNLYVECGRRGDLFVTIQRLRLWQPQTQAQPGGCTDIYLEMGTYIKSFYSVIVAPSCVKIAKMGVAHQRIHHAVQWKYACPEIIDPSHRKQ